MKRLYPVTIRSRILHRHPGSALTSQAAARPLPSTRRDCRRSASCNPRLANFLGANVRLPQPSGGGILTRIIMQMPLHGSSRNFLSTFDHTRDSSSHSPVARSIESIGRWTKMARGSCDKKVPLAASKEDIGDGGLLQARKPPRNVRR